jgi:hypothetical protein
MMGRHSATVQFTVEAYTGAQRIGYVTIGEQVHTVIQNPEFFGGAVRSISQNSKEIRAASTTYKLSVNSTEDWQLVIPESVRSWISVQVSTADGNVFPNGPIITASGDATVTISVARNTTNRRREAQIAIGNKVHKVIQAHR